MVPQTDKKQKGVLRSLDWWTILIYLALLIFGLVGQTVYKLRFVVQWVHSYRRKESTLPMSFWTLAIAGSVMLIVYGLIRHDWVLVAGQVSIVPSIRNVMIGLKQKKDEKAV